MTRTFLPTLAAAAALSLLAGGIAAAAASGLPTGKRQHKPFTITKPIDKAGTAGMGFKSTTTKAPRRR